MAPLLLRSAAASMLIASALAYDNGMAKKPPMGWQTVSSCLPLAACQCLEASH
eukprot:COSAG04_NODE_111_length_25781_cov_90.291761_10_plen_53_part_00